MSEQVFTREIDEIERRLDDLEEEIGATEVLKDAEHAWAHSISQMIQTPGCRGVWLGGFDSIGDATDLSGLGNHLVLNGNPDYNRRDFAPYLDFDGTGDFLLVADNADHDIGGNETFVAGAAQGLMVGGWFYFDRALTTEALIGKYGAAGQRSFRLIKQANDTVRFDVSNNGTAIVSSGTITVVTGQWYHIFGLFSPSGADNVVSVYVDGVVSSGVAGIATLFNSNAGLEISGSVAGGAALLDGRSSACGLYAMASASFIVAMGQQQRAAYGA